MTARKKKDFSFLFSAKTGFRIAIITMRVCVRVFVFLYRPKMLRLCNIV